jgi:hypothetical protein
MFAVESGIEVMQVEFVLNIKIDKALGLTRTKRPKS